MYMDIHQPDDVRDFVAKPSDWRRCSHDQIWDEEWWCSCDVINDVGHKQDTNASHSHVSAF
jgi:hypothetical protein